MARRGAPRSRLRGEPPSRATLIPPRRSGSMSGALVGHHGHRRGRDRAGAQPGPAGPEPDRAASALPVPLPQPAGCARRGSLGRGRGAGDRPRRPWPSSAGSFVTRSAGTARRWWRPSGALPARGPAMAAARSRTSGGPSTGRVTAVGRATSAMTTPRSTWRGIARPGRPTQPAWWGPRPSAQVEPPGGAEPRSGAPRGRPRGVPVRPRPPGRAARRRSRPSWTSTSHSGMDRRSTSGRWCPLIRRRCGASWPGCPRSRGPSASSARSRT